MTDIEFITGVLFFGCLWIPFAIVGTGFLLHPRKAIDNSVEMAKKLPGYNPDRYPNPYSKGSILHYRLMGLFLIIATGIPLIVILILGN